MKAVIVDDELPSLAAFLPHIADNASIDVKLFRSAPLKALEYVKNENVSVVFTDVRMPYINGVELAEKMIAARSDVKIVIVTAYAQDENDIRRRLGVNLADIVYKPFAPDRIAKIFVQLAKTPTPSPALSIRTFNSFDLFADGSAVDFTSSKAKELLALLVDANGSFVDLDKAVGCLWADKNAELGKRLYRDAVCRLRLTLQKVGAERLVRFERARAVVDTSAANCDLWDLLNGKGELTGTYLPKYDWAAEREMYLTACFGEKK